MFLATCGWPGILESELWKVEGASWDRGQWRPSSSPKALSFCTQVTWLQHQSLHAQNGGVDMLAEEGNVLGMPRSGAPLKKQLLVSLRCGLCQQKKTYRELRNQNFQMYYTECMVFHLSHGQSAHSMDFCPFPWVSQLATSRNCSITWVVAGDYFVGQVSQHLSSSEIPKEQRSSVDIDGPYHEWCL